MSPDPMPTPTASPSGILCIVIARTRSHTALSLEDPPSMPMIACMWGISRSINEIVIAPSTTPSSAGSIPPSSIAGRSRLVKLAAIITPDANPSPRSETLLNDVFKNSIGRAPTKFIADVKSPASAASIMKSPPDMLWKAWARDITPFRSRWMARCLITLLLQRGYYFKEVESIFRWCC